MMLPLAGWGYCKPITVQHAYVDSDLPDFHYVVFIDADTDIGAHALATGYDIRITAADGVTLLSYERRSFAIAAGAATGRLVVKTTVHTAGGDIIYIHYGKAGASDGADAPNAYNSNVKAIWPLNEAAGGAGAIKDRTSNANHLTDYGSPIFGEAGPIDKAIFLDDVDAYLEAAHSASLSLGGSFALLAWIKKTAYSSYRWIISKQPNDGDASHQAGNYEFRINDSIIPNFGFQPVPGASTFGAATTAMTNDLWQRVVVVFEYVNGGSTVYFYIDGVPCGSHLFGVVPLENTQTLFIGKRRDNYAYLGGWMAEVEVVASPLSAAWMKFDYRNIYEADHEQTWGAEEAAPSGDIFLFGANC
jgi:hypothetical protein